ncbi:hypothetical protein INR49_018241 [Caranx melampygus]|nr:hypothetical protein INR49_018241 [Caranx melampygus]
MTETDVKHKFDRCQAFLLLLRSVGKASRRRAEWSGAGSLSDLLCGSAGGTIRVVSLLDCLPGLEVSPGGSNSGGPRRSPPCSGESDTDHAVALFAAPTCPEPQLLQEGRSVRYSQACLTATRQTPFTHFMV